MNRRAGVLLACLLAGAGGIPAAMAASEAEERFLIMELMDRYGIVHDFGTPEEFASVFTDDAVIQSGGRQVRGRDALIAQAKRDEERYWTFEGPDGTRTSFMRHVISNRQVRLTGPDTAEGSSYVMTVILDRSTGPKVFSMSRYVDRYRKVDGQWRIEHRTIIGESGDPEIARKFFR